MNVQLILAGGSDVTLEHGGVCLFVCCFFLFVKLPAVEGDIPVLVDSEEHGGGGEGGQAGELTLAHLRFSLRLSLRLVKLLL